MAASSHIGEIRSYSPGLGRWINRDPIGEAGGLNLYAAMGNSPTNFSDAYGLWKTAEPSTWFDGNGYQGSGLEFNGDAWHRGGLGAEAAVDGIIPFWDPFADAGGYNPCDSDMQFSWKAGAFARDVYFMSRTNLGTWAKNPVAYEAGQVTLPKAIWETVSHLDVIKRGEWLMAEYGGYWKVADLAKQASFWDWYATIKTGLTPPGYFVIGSAAQGVEKYLWKQKNDCGCN